MFVGTSGYIQNSYNIYQINNSGTQLGDGFQVR